MTSAPTDYYPPRARWYSRFHYLWRSICRRLPFDRLRLPGGFTFWQFLGALIVPGYVYFVLGRPTLGRIALGSYAGLAAFCVVMLGSTVVTVAYGLMIALHAVSAASLVESWFEPGPLGRRLALVLFATVAVGSLIYFPLQRWIQSSVVMPLRVENRPLLVIPDEGEFLQAGDVRVFRFTGGARHRGVVVGEGFVVGEVRGGPGDRIQFGEGTYSVNHRVYPSRPLMPQAGEWTVPENHWFIWPDSSIRVHGAMAGLGPEQRDAILRGMALVPMSDTVGRPLRWWFWRRLYVP